MACASGASAEPEVALETGQLTGMVGIKVVVWLIELELVVELFVVVVELVVVIVVSTAAWITIVMVMVWVSETLAPPT